MSRYRSKSWRAYQPRSSVTDVTEPSAPPSAAPRKPVALGACRILGLDPGSRRTGYGLIEVDGAQIRCLTQGRIEVDGLPLVERLARIHAGVAELIAVHQPAEVAVEKVFVNRNVESALKLGQARGAALAALGPAVTLAEYAPRAIKLATVGFGGADKMQVVHMMRTLLQLSGKVTSDAADALAVAMCHAQHRRLGLLMAGGVG